MIYVIVIHKLTMRGFTLNRNYGIIDQLISNAKIPMEPVDSWDGWKPEDVGPEWAIGIPKDEFVAYWMY